MSRIIEAYLLRPTPLAWMDLPDYYRMVCSLRRSFADIKAGRYITLAEFQRQLKLEETS